MITEELIELMQRAKAGDKTAFERLYVSCYRPVYLYLLRRVRNVKDAEDMAQQVFLKVYTSQSTFMDKTISPLAYLFTAARNTLLSFLDKEKRFVLNDLDAAEIIKDPKDMESDVQQADLVRRALSVLPEEQKEVLECKFHLGLSTKEIADKLSRSEATVRQMQCRALRRMREFLQDESK